MQKKKQEFNTIYKTIFKKKNLNINFISNLIINWLLNYNTLNPLYKLMTLLIKIKILILLE